MRNLVIALVLLVGAARIAAAEDLAAYEVEGEADAGGSDPRVAALDEAFGRAVASALAELVALDVRKANKATLDREIVARARLWVVKFTVNRDATNEGRRQLAVTVRVDRDKMRARLGELKIAVQQATQPSQPTQPTQPGTEVGRGAVVLLRVAAPEGARASFGPSADKDAPGLAALAATLRTSGFAIRKQPATGTVRTAELPAEDGEAEALANEAKAEVAAVAGVTVGAPVAVRGVAGAAVLVTARVRLVERGKKQGEGVATMAARGTEATVIAAAIDRALVAAIADALPSQARPVPGGFTGADTPLAEPGIVMVRLPAKTPWGLVAAELKYLSGARGITRAVLRRMSPAGWVIGVSTGESAQKIAQIAKKAPGDTSASVKVVGDIVELSLGAP